jgi:hypothetical protein
VRLALGNPSISPGVAFHSNLPSGFDAKRTFARGSNATNSPIELCDFINRRRAMKLVAASLVGIALIASPVLAQQDNTATPDQQRATTTHVRTTTRHVHATNVPRRATQHRARHHHHTVRCGCPPTHLKMHHAKTHHIVKKTTTTTTKS